MKKIIVRFAVLLLPTALLLHLSCQRADTASGPQLPDYFTSISPGDTLIITSLEETEGGEVIPFSTFFNELDTLLLDQMIYYPDSNDISALLGHWSIPLDDQFDAKLLEIQQSWFRFNYLLLYSKEERRFTGLFPAAYFYGGDGGQVIGKSWLFGFENNRALQLVARRLERSTFPEEGEFREVFDESVALWEWEQHSFREGVIRDSSRWINEFPIDW